MVIGIGSILPLIFCVLNVSFVYCNVFVLQCGLQSARDAGVTIGMRRRRRERHLSMWVV